MPRELRHIVEILVSGLGLAGYVYLVGGLVVWVKFDAAGLPATDTVSSFGTSDLFLMGLPTLLVAIGLLVGLGAVGLPVAAGLSHLMARLQTKRRLRRAARRRKAGKVDRKETWTRRHPLWAAIGLLALTLVGSGVAIWLSPPEEWRAAAAAVGTVVLSLPLLLWVQPQLPRLDLRNPRAGSQKALWYLLAFALVAGLFLQIVGQYDEPQTVRRAEVRLKSSGACFHGAFVTETASGVYIANGPGHSLLRIPADEVAALRINREEVRLETFAPERAKCSSATRAIDPGRATRP